VLGDLWAGIYTWSWQPWSVCLSVSATVPCVTRRCYYLLQEAEGSRDALQVVSSPPQWHLKRLNCSRSLKVIRCAVGL